MVYHMKNSFRNTEQYFSKHRFLDICRCAFNLYVYLFIYFCILSYLLIFSKTFHRYAVISIKLQNTIKKLHNTASRIAFIKKALFVNVKRMKKIVLNHLKTY